MPDMSIQHKFKVTVGPPIIATKLKQSKTVHDFFKSNIRKLKTPVTHKINSAQKPFLEPFLELKTTHQTTTFLEDIPEQHTLCIRRRLNTQRQDLLL